MRCERHLTAGGNMKYRSLFRGLARTGGSISQAIFVAILAFTATGAYAQTSSGRLVGTVTDPSGAEIQNAIVTVTNINTGYTRSVDSSQSGEFVADSLPVGSYRIDIKASGFRSSKILTATITADGILRQDVRLSVGSSDQTVEVSGNEPLVDTTNSSMGEDLNTKQIESLPLNGRIFSQLVQTVPGAVAAGFGSAPESASGVGAQTSVTASVNGLPWGGTTYTLDGINNMELLNAFMNVVPPLDAIEEVKISTNNASATVGTYGGAQVNAIIKSGTNKWHGSAFEFFRGKDLNATRWEATTKAPYTANQFGGSIGGPILHNRLFFFADYQGIFLDNGVTYNLSVPTTLMDQGYFLTSQFGPIYDPQTKAPFPIVSTSGGPAYQIPTSRFDSVAAKMVANNSIWPTPNIAGPNVNNFNANTTETDRLHTGDVKVDYQLHDGDRIFARESYQHRNLTAPSPGTRFIQINDVNSQPRDHNAAIGYDHTFNQRMINTFRFGFNRFYTLDFGNDFGTNENQTLGIPNSVYAAYPATSGIANFNFGGGNTNVATTGTQSWTDSHRITNVYEFVDNFTVVSGRHTVVIGGNYRRLQASLTNANQNQSGEFDFTPDYTSSCTGQPGCSTATGGDKFASFLLGLPSDIQRGFVSNSPATRANLFAVYGQDDFRVNSKLTLNLALRWDVVTPAIDKANNQANFDLGTGLLDLAHSGNRAPNVNTYYGGYSPRVGFAYSPNGGETAVHGAYGITHFPANFGGIGGALERNYPFFQQYVVNSNIQYTPSLSVSGDGLPALTVPVAVNNTLLPPANLSVNSMSRNFQVDVATAWNVGVEQKLTATSSLSITYVGTKGTHIFRQRNIDVAQPGPGDLASRRLFAGVAPQISDIEYYGADGKSLYNAFQVEARKTTSFGLEGRVSYTWSQQKDNTSIWNPLVDSLNYGKGTNQISNVPNNFIGTAILQLPFGRGRHFLGNANALANGFLGGWQFATTTMLQSGQPLNFNAGFDNLNSGFTNRASITCANPQPSRSVNAWFNTSCFTTPALYVYGNSGYGPVRGPAYINADLTLSKFFDITERAKLQIQADAFNLTNTPHYSNPDTNLSDGGFGRITGTNGNPRQIQLGAHLTF
jgi:Carboxypeptidase regulatory-like domain/TonB dependent receptor